MGEACCKHEEHRSCIARVPIFNHLATEQMDEIMDTVRVGRYAKGEVLYRAGELADSLYILSSGKVKIYRLSESGKEQIVRILTAGDFTGELALFKVSAHEAYAEALEDTEVCMIVRSELQDFLIKYPSISIAILAEFSHRLETSEKQTTRVSIETVETRLAFYLAECIDGEQQSSVIELPMSRKDLASYLGTTAETLSRNLTKLEENGYIRQLPGRKIEILDLEGLLLV